MIMEGSVYPRPDALGAGPVVVPGKSAASWPAIIAGAFVATSVSLILLALGSGLGITSILTSADHRISGTAIVATAAIWLIVTQWISAGLGGYIAGRLRTRWLGTHRHEVFFRDTAHGLVTWAVATVVLAVLVGASLPSMVAVGLHAASGKPSTDVQNTMSSPGFAAAPYGIDKLFRSASSAAGQDASGPKVEADHILKNALATGTLPDADRTYLAALIAAKTGISASEAETRVNDWLAKSMEADAKTKLEAAASREAAIYTALSLLVGAFIASVAAALGGRLRDEHA
jgi:hypothetical protein